MPARKQSDRTSTRKSKNQVIEEPEPTGGAASGAFGAQLMAVMKASVLYQVGLKMPVILQQFPVVVKQLQAGTYTASVNKAEEPKGSSPLKAPVVEASLFDRIGGAAAVDAAVDKFYGKIVADPSLDALFGHVPMDNLKKMQTNFLTMAFGGPNNYGGKTMKEAHQGKGITEANFSTVAGHLSATLKELGVPDAEHDEAIVIAASVKGDIVEVYGEAAPTAEKVLDCEVKGDASSLFVLLATRLTVANPLGLFATGDECVKAFRTMKGLEFDGGPKSKKKNGVSARLMGNVQNNLLQYIHILWALMMLRSLLFRSFFACLPWLFLYQVGSVMLPLQKTAKVPLPLEKAPLEFRVVGTMFLHGLVWFFFLYEFVFRVWWLEWVFAAALIGAHTYVFRPLDA